MIKIKPTIIAVIVLFLIVAYGVFLYIQKTGEGTLVDKTFLFCEVDEVVKRELVKLGIKDSDIVKWVHEEKENNSTLWIQLTKEVLVQSEVSFGEWESEIKSSLSYIDASVYKTIIDSKEDTITLEIGRDELVMEIITLRHRPSEAYRVAIILDDLGNQSSVVDGFLELDIPLTYAILPYTPFSKTLAKKLKRLGHDTLLHLPCEPMEYPKINPGPGAVLISMKPSQVKRTIRSNLTTVPGVIGVNNHQGSRIMSDRKMVKYMLEVIKSKNLFFLDSRTTAASKAPEVAKELGMKVIVNNVFLDNEDRYKYVSDQMERLRVFVKKYGKAIAIGHINRKATLEVLSDYIPKFKEDGISFVYISDLIE